MRLYSYYIPFKYFQSHAYILQRNNNRRSNCGCGNIIIYNLISITLQFIIITLQV